jgi:hypothetical protein
MLTRPLHVPVAARPLSVLDSGVPEIPDQDVVPAHPRARHLLDPNGPRTAEPAVTAALIG